MTPSHITRAAMLAAALTTGEGCAGGREPREPLADSGWSAIADRAFVDDALAFIGRRTVSAPPMPGRPDFSGLCSSYAPDPLHPDSRYLAEYGRVFIYDAALAIYAQLKCGRSEAAARGVDALARVAAWEERQGFRGVFHFSYNTWGDGFIDPRGPLGATLWALNAAFAYALATGDTTRLAWATRAVRSYVFSQQVADSADPRYGLFRAGLENPVDLARGDAMGYAVHDAGFEHLDELLLRNQRLSQTLLGISLPCPTNRVVAAIRALRRDPGAAARIINTQVEYVSTEHNADALATLRLAYRANSMVSPRDPAFLGELRRRHDLAVSAMAKLWILDPDGAEHFVTGMNPDGSLNPSVAVDNNTWAGQVLLPLDEERAWKAIQFTHARFRTRQRGIDGLFFFDRSFVDRYVQPTPRERLLMERMIQPEATFGFISLLHQFCGQTRSPERKAAASAMARELYQGMVRFRRASHRGPAGFAGSAAEYARLAGHALAAASRAAIGEPRGAIEDLRALAESRTHREGLPYASTNVRGYFTTLRGMAGTATGAIVTAVLLGADDSDFIGVPPPWE